MARVLVTGGAGYIGSHCVRALLRRGDEVVIYDNFSTGFKESIPPGVKVIFGDVRDSFLLGRVMKDSRIDSVIHFAAKLSVGESVERPLEYYDNNVGGTLSVLKSCESAGVPRLIFSSTAAVYGPIETSRSGAENLKGQGGGNSSSVKSPPKSASVREDQLCFPESPYGTTKLFSERMIADFASQGKINSIVLRYFNVAGADMSEHLGQRSLNATHLVKVCCEVALGMRPHLEIFGNDYPTRDGTGVRDYIHVQDLVEAHLLALDRLHSALDLSKNEATLRSANKPFDIFNVGYGRGYSVREVVQTFNEICGKQIFVVDRPRRAGDVAEVVADVQKIQHELGFLPQKNSLNKICKDALDWEKHLRGR